MYAWSWYFDLAAWLHPFIHIECQGFGSEADLSRLMICFVRNVFIFRYMHALADALERQDALDNYY